MTFSEQFANYIVNFRFEKIPKDVVHFTKLCNVYKKHSDQGMLLLV